MSNIVRAWKDETYRQSLSVEELAVLPVNPVGEVELTDVELEAVSGACGQSNAPQNNSNQDSNNIKQNVDQKAFATFGSNSIVVNSYVVCDADNSADPDAVIDSQNRGYSY